MGCGGSAASQPAKAEPAATDGSKATNGGGDEKRSAKEENRDLHQKYSFLIEVPILRKHGMLRHVAALAKACESVTFAKGAPLKLEGVLLVQCGQVNLGNRVLGPAACVADFEGSEVMEDGKGLRIPAETWEKLLQASIGSPQQAQAWCEEHQETQHESYKLADFREVGLVGCGGFAFVTLCAYGEQASPVTLKTLSKGNILKIGFQDSVLVERMISCIVESPFVMKHFGTFSTQEELYFVNEALLGGELYKVYGKHALHGKEEHARYYIASVFCAFVHLHSLLVVYRGLKPENCVLDAAGHLKLVDMGDAKVILGKTYTTIGTPDYFAPELIQSSGHGFAVDWWCLGIFFFELLAGHPPFEAATPMDIYSKVMAGIDKAKFPKAIKSDAKELVMALLKRNAEERLPMLNNGQQLFKDSNFFTGFDWSGFENLTLSPPFVPNTSGPLDISNSAASKADKPRRVPVGDQTVPSSLSSAFPLDETTKPVEVPVKKESVLVADDGVDVEELRAENEELKRQNAELENKVDTLTKQLKELQTEQEEAQ